MSFDYFAPVHTVAQGLAKVYGLFPLLDSTLMASRRDHSLVSMTSEYRSWHTGVPINIYVCL